MHLLSKQRAINFLNLHTFIKRQLEPPDSSACQRDAHLTPLSRVLHSHARLPAVVLAQQDLA